jgi:hypothetical protein
MNKTSKPNLGDHRIRSYSDYAGRTRWQIERYVRGFLYITRKWAPTHLMPFKTREEAEERLRKDTAPAGEEIIIPAKANTRS